MCGDQLAVLVHPRPGLENLEGHLRPLPHRSLAHGIQRQDDLHTTAAAPAVTYTSLRTPQTLHVHPTPGTSLVESSNRPRVRCWTRSAIFDWCRLVLTTAPVVPVGYACCWTQRANQARPGLRPYSTRNPTPVGLGRPPQSPPPTSPGTTSTASRGSRRSFHLGTVTSPDPVPPTPSENRSLCRSFLSHTHSTLVPLENRSLAVPFS